MTRAIDLDGKKVLVVEDDDMNFIYLSQLFKITKGNMERAKTGNEAIRMAAESTYDLILMDIQLPDMNGNDVTRHLRAEGVTTPIIAQTAARSESEVTDSLEAGCNAILTKPFKLADFTEKVQSVLVI